MLSFRQLFLVSLAATSVLADYASVLAKLQNPIDSNDIPALKTAINNYPSSGSANTGALLIAIANANNKLVNDINAVTTDAKGSATPTAAQAQPVLDYIKGQLLTDTKAVLVALDGKKTNLIANGAKNSIKQELQKTKDAIDALATELINKAPTAAQKSDGTTTKNTYDNEIQTRINAFS